MVKLIAYFYFPIFILYTLFTRQPDFFDSEKTVGNIHLVQNQKDNINQAIAHFAIGKKSYSTDATFPLRWFKEGERVEILYETEKPEKAQVYCWWGYWIKPSEIFYTLLFFCCLYAVAVFITNSPTPEAVMEQESYKPEKKTRYS